MVVGDFDGEPRIFGRFEDRRTSEVGSALYGAMSQASIGVLSVSNSDERRLDDRRPLVKHKDTEAY